jgi:hypothetical protein
VVQVHWGSLASSSPRFQLLPGTVFPTTFQLGMSLRPAVVSEVGELPDTALAMESDFRHPRSCLCSWKHMEGLGSASPIPTPA